MGEGEARSEEIEKNKIQRVIKRKSKKSKEDAIDAEYEVKDEK